MEFQPVRIDHTELNSLNYDLMREMTDNIISESHNEFDNIVKKQIEKLGYKFGNEDELIQFVKNRCRREIYIDRSAKIFVDNIAIIVFMNDFKIEFNKNEVKATSILCKLLI